MSIAYALALSISALIVAVVGCGFAVKAWMLADDAERRSRRLDAVVADMIVPKVPYGR